MCGRFTLRTSTPVLIRMFDLGEQAPPLPPRYNIAPTQQIAAIRRAEAGDGRELIALQWGLIPSWAKDPKIGSQTINARGETVAEKPAFRAAFKRRRCLIPADGFYEWEKIGRRKQPHFIHRPDDQPFAFAGLWETWQGLAGPVETATIITTAANELMQSLHHRMPVILAPNDYALWLDPEVQTAAPLAHLLTPCPDDELCEYNVGMQVNSPRHDGPDCVEPEALLF